MNSFVRTFLAPALATLLLGAATHAQQFQTQPTPFSVWLDFAQLADKRVAKAALPIWMESVQIDEAPAQGAQPAKTIHRLRLRRFGHLNSEVQLRVFFDDKPGASPIVTAWSETGHCAFQSAPLGSGLGLSASETLLVPVAAADYIDIETPGHGRNIRGAFVSTLRKVETRTALDFGDAAPVQDPFGNRPPLAPVTDDAQLFGRIRATLDDGPPLKLTESAPLGTIEFWLDAQPKLALVVFEILDAEPTRPVQVFVNKRALGPAAVQLPDLADPAYLGSNRALERDMRFRYTGWVRAQIALPGSLLRDGLNKLVFQLSKDASPVAIRAVEIQLKHPWEQFQYELQN